MFVPAFSPQSESSPRQSENAGYPASPNWSNCRGDGIQYDGTMSISAPVEASNGHWQFVAVQRALK